MILKKTQTTPAAGIIEKTYSVFGIPVLTKQKNPTSRKYNILGIKISQSRKHPLLFTPANEESSLNSSNFASLKENLIPLETIKNIIAQPNIKTISFDIFDTLLIRPVIEPTDIFYLISAKLKKNDNIDFISYRLKAEKKLNNPHATLKDIYHFIEKKYHLPKQTIAKMYKAELQAEFRLLSRREDVYSLYLYAISLGKRVIATSDMYLSPNFLKSVLRAKGYTNISQIYVSNNEHARKDNGTLFESVIKKEQTSPSSILHIGDNELSDRTNALKSGLTAIYYPSINHILLNEHKILSHVFPPQISTDPMARLIMGWIFNYCYKDLTKLKNEPMLFDSLKTFSHLCLTPLLFHIANSIAHTQNIQQNYPKILFASRDGYLPKLAYDLFRKYEADLTPSQYIYAGRRAYFSALVTNFISYAQNTSVDSSSPYTIKDFLEANVFDKNLREQILLSLSSKEKSLDFNRHKPQIIKLLKKHRTALNAYLKTHRQNSTKYYQNIYPKAKPTRAIVFDCGYSGSISTALSKLLGLKVDKIYLWETPTNQALDKKNQTKTHVLITTPQLFKRHNIVYEELFSPLKGGCIGFDEQEKPLFESCHFSAPMRHTLHTIQKEALYALNAMLKDFKPWLKYIKLTDTQILTAPLAYGLISSPYNEMNLLKHITFPDPSFLATPETLPQKIWKKYQNQDSFANTGFNNPLYELTPPLVQIKNPPKIGIHCHLYNITLAQELLQYLSLVPLKFDLYITTCQNSHKNILKNLFSQKTVPNLKKFKVIKVENRGRDVAPWLVNLKDIQKNYQLFCHIHAKESTHLHFGTRWRQYLYHNLISQKAITDIIASFEQNKKLGIVFPPCYKELKSFWQHLNISPLCQNYPTITKLLTKLKISTPYTQTDIYYSAGTMMWYRPQALKTLFELNLKTTDFAPEPLPVDGTLAHAIERIPPLVCQNNGWQAKTYKC